ncbi:HSP20-like chaperone,PIH1 domain [Cinara cedri]|uniref:PIH1 domain-containing protein 1 n=1 Tax=Cinara cedri TaxID=506608 RepID=A0A5E4NL61_9HEMI|nr:HSP20-like chaperone,PIH1 domain [Cinara cedri]
MLSKNFLDVDESIIEKNLLIQSNEEQEFEQFVNGFLNPNSGKLVKPAPGICIKTIKIDDKSKVFINLCHHSDIPPPEDITHDELIEVLNSKDPERYCVPLSIGTEHEETIKSGVQVKAYDVAVNSEFFKKCQNDELFKTFIISATIEGIAEKFKIEISSENPILLKNKKCLGSLQQHRIQQRPPRPSSIKKKTLIEELNPKGSSSQLETHIKPEYRVYVQPEDNPEQLIVDVWLPDVNNSQEISLKCGEDCIVLNTKKQTKYELDIFLPYTIIQQNTNVTFNTVTKFLSVTSTIAAVK